LIPKIFCQAFHSHEVGQEFHVLAAVVDRMPHATLDELEVHNFHKSWKRDGDEGVSVCILDSEIAAPDLWTVRDQPRNQETMSVQQQSTISFLLQTSPENTEAQVNSIPSQSVVSRLVQLPVANTLFRNGRTSTMLAQRWVVTNTQSSKPGLRLTEENALLQQSLCLADVISDYTHRNGYLLSVPQTSITPPRIVTAAMGNIIRTIQMGDNNMPASTELEKAVARVSQTAKLSGKIAGIWALVTPQENRVSQPHVRPKQTLQYAFDSGSRLHKVLSGGGGWGNKQGLLALDPDSEYSMDREASQEQFGDGEDIEAEKVGALGEVVKPGDSVSFWAHISPVSGENSEPKGNPSKSAKVVIPRSVQFGTIPSTMDLMPGSVATDVKDTTAPLYTLVINHFGMLSEHGMSMRISTIGPEDKSALGAEQVGVVVQTKVDTPYSRISMLGTGKHSSRYLANVIPGAYDKRKAGTFTSIEKTGMSQIKDREPSAVPMENFTLMYEPSSKSSKTFRMVAVDSNHQSSR